MQSTAASVCDHWVEIASFPGARKIFRAPGNEAMGSIERKRAVVRLVDMDAERRRLTRVQVQRHRRAEDDS